MTRAEALGLGITADTLDEIEVDISQVIVHREFKRRSGGDYRSRAIDRLVALRVPWHSEWNITHETVTRYVGMTCPYCSAQMKPTGGGGNAAERYVNFSCECGASAGLTLPADRGVSFTPPAST